MNISEFTEANGWTEFSVGVSNCQRKYAKQFPTKYQCQCNTKSTIQVVLEYWVMAGHGEAVNLVLTGECPDEEWVELRVYGLKTLDNIDHHCQKLLTGWESINAMVIDKLIDSSITWAIVEQSQC